MRVTSQSKSFVHFINHTPRALSRQQIKVPRVSAQELIVNINIIQIRTQDV